MIFKPVSGLKGLVNRPRTPKLWAIAHKTDLKHDNDKFSTMTLKPLSREVGFRNSQKPKTVDYSS